ncbi:MAG: hypothetical protein IJX71_02875, partial [Oscillospiraceae bacterium]|nr:hypothetical protein [Oscillospiraceae bacterium]
LLTPTILIAVAVIRVRQLIRTPASTVTHAASPSQQLYTCSGKSIRVGADCRYQFRLVRKPGTYRCYILRTPSYGNRPHDCHVAHYLMDSTGKYICFTADIPHLEQAKTLCQQWSDMTQRYIETGKTFEQ